MNGDQDSSVTQKTAIGAAWLIVWRMATRGLGVISTLVLARILVPADFGLIAMAVAFSGSVEMLSRIGLQEALVRRHEMDKSVLDTAFTIQVVRAFITGAVVWLGAPFAANWFAEPQLVAILATLAVVNIVTGFENIGVVEFRRSMRFDRQVLLMSVPRLGQVLITIAFALYLRNFEALLIGIAAQGGLRVAMSYWVHPFRPSFGLKHWRELVGFSFWMWASALPALVWDRADAFILGPAMGPSNLALYLIAIDIALLAVTELVAPAADALFSGFSMAQRQGSKPADTALPIAIALCFLLAPIAIAVSASSGYIVALLGPKWVDARIGIAILSATCIFSAFGYVACAALVTAGRFAAVFVVRLVASLLKAAAFLILVLYTTDLLWVAVATVAVTAGEAFFFVMAILGIAHIKASETLGTLARVAVVSAATIAVLELLGLGWTSANLPVVAAVIYGAITGIVTVAVFGGATLGLWMAIGRPGGPERRILDLAAGFSALRFVKRFM